MTKEEAIDILKNPIVRFGRTNGKTVYAEALQTAIKALEEPQWIPCSERLPDKECFVLVTVNDGAIYTDLSLFRHDGRFIEHTGDVIAWMPLPEPYKERWEEVKNDKKRSDYKN